MFASRRPTANRLTVPRQICRIHEIGSMRHERAQTLRGVGAESVWMRPHRETRKDPAVHHVHRQQAHRRRYGRFARGFGRFFNCDRGFM